MARRTRRGALRALLVGGLVGGTLLAVAPAAAHGEPPARPVAPAAALPPAPVWTAAAGAVPHRPATCPPLPSVRRTTAGASARAGRPGTGRHGTATQTRPAQASLTGDPLWPPPPAGTNPEHYAADDRTPPTSPPTVPTNWAADSNDWKLASTREADTAVASNPQELCGVEGSSVDLAWQTTTGRPTTVIAVLDSGIDWCNPGLVDRIALNRAALPLPENAQGLTKPQLEAQGQAFTDGDPYDLTDIGVLDVSQYASDPRVAAVAAQYGGLFCADPANDDAGYSGISPEDLIRTFADATFPDGAVNPYVLHRQGPAGYTEAIAGWNMLDNNDDPYDDVHAGHGTDEGTNMAGTADTTGQEVGPCPDCMILPVRVSTSFVGSGNEFTEGVLFAVDSGATIVSEALGTLDATESTTQAIAYASAHGVPIVGSAGDEESQHANLPAAWGHIIVVNSVTDETSWSPPSYLYLNGCTNYGAQISVSVPSTGCSSEATGKTAGIVGLLESAAADAVARGTITDYPGLHDALGRPVPLSSDEVMQLVTMSADDVDFATAAPNATPPAPGDNYSVSAPSVPFAATKQFPTTPGYDEYTGWGRIDAARIVRWVTEGRIPPEAEIDSPGQFETFSPSGHLLVTGTVGAVRSSSYRYQVDVAVGAAPSAGAWRLVAQGSGSGEHHGLLASVPLAALAALFPGGAASLEGGAVHADGTPDPDRFTFSIRVLVEDARGLVGIARQADFLHADPDLVAGFPRWLGSSIVASPRLAPLGPGGENVLLVPESGGTIDALLPDGRELPGWPVHTDYMPAHLGEEAYTSGAITARPRGEILGGIAVGDLAHAGGDQLDVVATDFLGNAYAWNAAGHLLPGWPVHVDPDYSVPSARNAENRLLPGFLAAPTLADLTGTGGLDVIAPSMDRHVYAWDASGRAVPGWPVLVVDPSEVQSVDPVTNQVTFLPGADVLGGTELVDTVAVGALNGNGPPEVVVGSDEQYAGAPNAELGALGQLVEAAGATTGNGRLYAIWHDGSLHPAPSGAPDPPGMPDPGAFVPGWPVHVALLDAGVDPTVGEGVTGSPALVDLTGSGQLEVVTASVAGPAYVLDPDGTSFLGDGSDGLPNVTGYETPKGSLLNWTEPALGSPVVAPLGPADATPSIVAPAASLGQLVDEVYPADQTPHANQVDAWSAATGALETGFPALMNDLQYSGSPIVADVNGPDAGGYLVEGSGVYDLRAYGPGGAVPPSFPKFTGGWMTYGPAFGPWGTLADQVLVGATRSGELLAWTTPTPACASSGPWPQAHHDLWNTGDLDARGTPVTPCPAGSEPGRDP